MKRGVTLIETMVSLAILSVVMLAVLALTATLGSTTRKAEQNYQASLLAQTLLEREKSKPFSAISVGGPVALALDDDDSTFLPGIKAEMLVSEPSGFGGRLKQIDVKLFWEERGERRVCEGMIRVCDLP